LQWQLQKTDTNAKFTYVERLLQTKHNHIEVGAAVSCYLFDAVDKTGQTETENEF